MISAFLYLSARSMVNRFRLRVRRLRQPRYVIGLVVGLAYLYFMFFRQAFQGAPRGNPSNFFARPEVSGSVELVMTLALFTMAALSWAWPSSSRAVTFSRAEVQFFFPAPVTRRQLLHYKILRTQLGTLISSAILTLVFRRGLLGSGWRLLTGLWLTFAILNLFFTGVSLRRASLLQHGASAWRRQWLPIGIVLGAIALIAWTAASNWSAIGGLTRMVDVVAELNRRASEGAVNWLLWPFRAVVRVPLSSSALEYWRALPGALAILAVNYVWVIRSDAAFEEASAEQAEKVAQAVTAFRQGRSAKIKGTPTPFKLAPTGRVETAIMWKNLILLGRYASLKTLLRLLPLFAVLAGMFSTGQRGVVVVAATFCLMTLLMTIILGPQVTRNDLRQDLARLAVLKTWPIRGATLLRGEILAPQALLTGIVWLCIVFGMFLVPKLPATGAAAVNLVLDRLSYGAAALLLAPALILVQLVVQNGIAVMFPAWVSIGGARARGIDAMGQRMLMMAGILLTLVVALIPAGIVAALAGFAVYFALGVVPVVLPAAVGTVVLVAECWLAVEAFGRILDRTDVSAVDPVE